MKKMKTLFVREFENNKLIGIRHEVTEGCEWVLRGEGVATVKHDGTCTMIQNGKLYRRYDAKRGKRPPAGAIPCCEPDAITGHHPHWIEVDLDHPKGDELIYVEGVMNSFGGLLENAVDGTYELCGPKINSNRENLHQHIFIRHGSMIVDCPRTFEGIKQYLKEHEIEGIVFHRLNEENDLCKIKRRDFGIKWR